MIDTWMKTELDRMEEVKQESLEASKSQDMAANLFIRDSQESSDN